LRGRRLGEKLLPDSRKWVSKGGLVIDRCGGWGGEERKEERKLGV